MNIPATQIFQIYSYICYTMLYIGYGIPEGVKLICLYLMYRLFFVLCWLWDMYKRAELLSVYFITIIKHSITYLALTQLFPVCCWQARFKSGNIQIMLHFAAVISYLAMDASTWDKWILLEALFWEFLFSKLISWKHFTDHTLHAYWMIIPHCLCILTWCENSAFTLRSAYTSMCHLIMLSLSTSILGQAVLFLTRLQYTCTAWSVFSSLKQLKFDIYIILCQYCHHCSLEF